MWRARMPRSTQGEIYIDCRGPAINVSVFLLKWDQYSVFFLFVRVALNLCRRAHAGLYREVALRVGMQAVGRFKRLHTYNR